MGNFQGKHFLGIIMALLFAGQPAQADIPFKHHNLEYAGSGDWAFDVFDAKGFRYNAQAPGSLPTGTYMIRIQGQKGLRIQKINVMR